MDIDIEGGVPIIPRKELGDPAECSSYGELLGRGALVLSPDEPSLLMGNTPEWENG
jgi:hypothetical protein